MHIRMTKAYNNIQLASKVNKIFIYRYIEKKV
jgi:hypothetical protein